MSTTIDDISLATATATNNKRCRLANNDNNEEPHHVHGGLMLRKRA
jgi:hypothetical protein